MTNQIIGAANLGFEAKHWHNDVGIGNGRGPEILHSAAKAVVEFVNDNSAPEVLRLAAGGIWLAVEHAQVQTLDWVVQENSRRHFHTSTAWKRFVHSPDGWRLKFIREGSSISKKVPKTLGVVMTRPDVEPSNLADTYVWVDPDSRAQGVATTALEQLSGRSEIRKANLRMPFDVDPANVAAAKLVERFTKTTEAATA